MNDSGTYSREALVEELRALAQRLQKKSISRSEFIRETGVSEWHVMKHFDTWNEFVTASELQPTDIGRIPDQELLEAMYQSFIGENGVTTQRRFNKVCRYSETVYRRRWGRWDNVLAEFRSWVATAHPDFPYMSQLPNADSNPVTTSSTFEKSSGHSLVWAPKGGLVYGPILNFRGLQHAPINEQGVVFLFGMVALELGFIVESVATGYPDCEAKRRIDRLGEKWERVHIEFEYQSRNFRDHGHDPAKCDVIICWEDNWPECPIEILELKSAIEALDQE